MDNEGIVCRDTPLCRLCGAQGDVIYKNLRDPLFGAPGVWGLRQCSDPSCGVGWVNPMPDPESLPDLYRSYHTHANVAEDGIETLAPIPFKLKRPALKALFSGLLPWWRHLIETDLNHFGRRKPGIVLDVGCGSGLFLSQMVGAGWKAVGIDFDEKAIASAKRVEGAEALAIDIFDPLLDGRQFDGIMLDNVIEHLPDPAGAISRCAELLAPDGQIVIITPNFDSLCREKYGQDWRGLETPRHLHLFTARALQNLVQSNGLPHARVFTRPMVDELYFMMWASELIMRGRGREPKRAPIRRRLMRLKNALSALTGTAKGEFLVCIAHRPV